MSYPLETPELWPWASRYADAEDAREAIEKISAAGINFEASSAKPYPHNS